MAKTLTERFSLAGVVTICEARVVAVRELLLIWGFLVLRNWGVIFEIHFPGDYDTMWGEKHTTGKHACFLHFRALLDAYPPLLRRGGGRQNFQLHSIHRRWRRWGCAGEAKFWHIDACAFNILDTLLSPSRPSSPLYRRRRRHLPLGHPGIHPQSSNGGVCSYQKRVSAQLAASLMQINIINMHLPPSILTECLSTWYCHDTRCQKITPHRCDCVVTAW